MWVSFLLLCHFYFLVMILTVTVYSLCDRSCHSNPASAVRVQLEMTYLSCQLMNEHFLKKNFLALGNILLCSPQGPKTPNHFQEFSRDDNVYRTQRRFHMYNSIKNRNSHSFVFLLLFFLKITKTTILAECGE